MKIRKLMRRHLSDTQIEALKKCQAFKFNLRDSHENIRRMLLVRDKYTPHDLFLYACSYDMIDLLEWLDTYFNKSTLS